LTPDNPEGIIPKKPNVNFSRPVPDREPVALVLNRCFGMQVKIDFKLVIAFT
jgi:hypothetical protein